MKKLFLIFSVIFFILASVKAQETGWFETAPGVWFLKVGEEQSITLLGAAGIEPDLSTLAKLPDPGFPLDTNKIRAEVIDGKTYLRFPLERDEEIYGLGLNFKTHNQRGRILNLHVDHYGGKDNGRTHAPVPFYLSSRDLSIV